MVEVDTIQAVLDSDYFIKKLNECIANWEKDYIEHMMK